MHTLNQLTDAIRRLPLQDRIDLERWFFAYFHSEPADLRVAEPAFPYGAVRRRLSLEEYIALEKNQQARHEYVAGEIFAMTGVSRPHNLINLNLATAFRNHVRGGPCQVFMAEFGLRFQVGEDHFSYYPDILVSCRPGTVQHDHLSDPTLVIEVLSPSTERTDRYEKLHSCRQIPSLEEYVLVAQNRPEVTFHRRGSGWKPEIIHGAEAVAQFVCLDFPLPMAAIYEGVE